eukprot:1136973-Pelagomonas_calceolata.AAC.6
MAVRMRHGSANEAWQCKQDMAVQMRHGSANETWQALPGSPSLHSPNLLDLQTLLSAALKE